MGLYANQNKQALLERFGLEPVPTQLRTSSWFDFLYIGVAFSVNAGNFLVPALAVLEGGLSFTYAVLSTVLGATIAFFFVSWLSLPGAVLGIPSQYAIRSILGIKGARFVASPVRTVTSLYWFAVQTIGGTYVIIELLSRIFHVNIPFYIVSVFLASLMSLLALIGFEAIKKATKYFIPFLLLGQGVIFYLFLSSSQTGATFITTITGEQSFSLGSFLLFTSLAFVQFVSGVSSSSDLARYAKSKNHSFYGLFSGNVIGYSLAAVLAAFSADALNHVNPFVSATQLTNSYVFIAIIAVCSFVSMLSINMSNAYTGGFSLLNSIPVLGRTKSAILFGVIGIILSCFPALVTEAKQFISLLGAFIIPLSAVIIIDFIFIKKSKIRIEDLERVLDKDFQVNYHAFGSIFIGIMLYLVLSHTNSPGLYVFIFTSIIYLFSKKINLHLHEQKKKSSVSL